MPLTRTEINALKPEGEDKISDELFFEGEKLLQMSSGAQFKRLDSHHLRLSRFHNGLYYNKGGQLFLYFPETDYYTQIIKTDFIISRIIKFDGFEFGKKFNLKNNQVWEQLDGLYMNTSTIGSVIIKDNKIKVDDWEFYPQVRRIK